MIRTIIAAAVLLGTAAQAENEMSEADVTQNLAYCGSQVATLAWFYQGVVNDGAPELQPDLDGLLSMQSILIEQVERTDEETIELFKRMTKASVNDLAEQMQGTQEQGALALSYVNRNVHGCAEIFFEKTGEADAPTEDADKTDDAADAEKN